jgi:hypothetical protein
VVLLVAVGLNDEVTPHLGVAVPPPLGGSTSRRRPYPDPVLLVTLRWTIIPPSAAVEIELEASKINLSVTVMLLALTDVKVPATVKFPAIVTLFGNPICNKLLALLAVTWIWFAVPLTIKASVLKLIEALVLSEAEIFNVPPPAFSA